MAAQITKNSCDVLIPVEAAFPAFEIAVLNAKDRIHARFRIFDLKTILHDAEMLFVDAKVSVFDDRAALFPSANLDGRSPNWDTEVGVELTDPEMVGHLRA